MVFSVLVPLRRYLSAVLTTQRLLVFFPAATFLVTAFFYNGIILRCSLAVVLAYFLTWLVTTLLGGAGSSLLPRQLTSMGPLMEVPCLVGFVYYTNSWYSERVVSIYAYLLRFSIFGVLGIEVLGAMTVIFHICMLLQLELYHERRVRLIQSVVVIVSILALTLSAYLLRTIYTIDSIAYTNFATFVATLCLFAFAYSIYDEYAMISHGAFVVLLSMYSLYLCFWFGALDRSLHPTVDWNVMDASSKLLRRLFFGADGSSPTVSLSSLLSFRFALSVVINLGSAYAFTRDFLPPFNELPLSWRLGLRMYVVWALTLFLYCEVGSFEPWVMVYGRGAAALFSLAVFVYCLPSLRTD